VPGELVLFDARDETYHTLNASASAAWRLLATGVAVEAAIETLTSQFDAPRVMIAEGVADMVEFALAHGLLNETAA
jgi:hypothetical protein